MLIRFERRSEIATHLSITASCRMKQTLPPTLAPSLPPPSNSRSFFTASLVNAIVYVGIISCLIVRTKNFVISLLFHFLFVQFADVTNVGFPPVYEKFLSIIGMFSLDLGWLLSATCVASGVGFYEKLL